MKAVILAAGKGTRISTITGGRCKSLLAFAGQTILDRQIDAAFAAGVQCLAIVVGHQKEQIIDHVGQSQAGRISKIAFIDNPDFAETNKHIRAR